MTPAYDIARRMTRFSSKFANLVAGVVLGAHLILLPALYFGVCDVIRKSHEDLFVEHARTFARFLADEFEAGAALDSAVRSEHLLDLAIIDGESRYAELIDGTNSIRSRLGPPQIGAPRAPNLRFGEGGNTYFIVRPIVHAGRSAVLRLGFDERPTQARIQLALNRVLLLLAGYLCLAIGIASYLSNRLSRPIRRLREVSRSIASGDYTQTLPVTTGIRELRGFAEDLEAMRRELVSVNDRLQEKIRREENCETRHDEVQKRLRHRQRLETVGTLAGGIAHEVNNMLVPILLFTDTAMQDLPQGCASRSDLERVLASARRAKNVVQNILTFSHVPGEPKLAPLDLRNVVAESVALFSALAPPSIEIRTEMAEHVPRVRADAALAMDLVMNLCTNALQAMQGTAGVLTVGLRATPSTSGAIAGVELWVADTGHGMEQATVERIFEPFFTTRPVGQGTGLGLSVVHGIVERFDARIAVESTPGAGTTFRIWFCVAEESAASDKSLDSYGT